MPVKRGTRAVLIVMATGILCACQSSNDERDPDGGRVVLAPSDAPSGDAPLTPEGRPVPARQWAVSREAPLPDQQLANMPKFGIRINSVSRGAPGSVDLGDTPRDLAGNEIDLKGATPYFVSWSIVPVGAANSLTYNDSPIIDNGSSPGDFYLPAGPGGRHTGPWRCPEPQTKPDYAGGRRALSNSCDLIWSARGQPPRRYSLNTPHNDGKSHQLFFDLPAPQPAPD